MIAEFYKRDQLPGESLADYITKPRCLATHCEFGECLNDALWDRLVCGPHTEETQRTLLTTKNLTLQEAIETILSMGPAEKDSRYYREVRTLKYSRLGFQVTDTD